MSLIFLSLLASSAETLRLYVHREEPKLDNPNGPCSTLLDIAPSAGVDGALRLASARLQVSLSSLATESGTTVTSLAALANDTTLRALEASHAEAAARRELAAAYRLFHMYGLAPFDGESINFIAARRAQI
ncbi:hypothetical protein EMIHUDRAFT_234211 [Emiliania huxleyi CCMP1516]|uniref:Uncharacterized protein n=2 Tax=Emiliania huxleyi TaxID=2903 RepID=A0A0D3JZS6_EMIH1|nr:hypothetical protein EMIHUDRAFT_215092 [Emiliania huxleyi CCMP1516]XP_005781440.1 hypothetical protein EMIHUDRAFT_234211 [Emiliania huxleyi CCMP1516]EOD10851.1 hypothetical protein EMIHUDRAFT_215092 [Emiliania huxleyi CCMP1516]EOD29011.1 hypothetical protein EMIHUDRAFT_234211 [Emiliania huxleyi CCMP1516]|eukprot:XP_005763280.1 hypothetical protein EMIHUDRAFT_215092 [Emiliania huxleyi CCMP1516]